jgi:hypothetical protein
MTDSYDGVDPPVEYVQYEDGVFRPVNLPPKVDRFGRRYLTCPVCHNETGAVTKESLGRHLCWHHPGVPATEDRPILRIRRWFAGRFSRRELRAGPFHRS